MTGQVEVNTPLSFVKHSRMVPGQTVWDHFRRCVPEDVPVMCVFNGAPLLRRDWERSLAERDSVQFVVLPQGGGGGGGSNKMLRAVAMVALSIIAPAVAPGIGGAIGVTSALGVSLTSAGLVIAGAFLINALLPPEVPGSASAQRVEESPTYSLSAQGNSARLLSPIPRLYGRHIIYPDFAAQPFASYEGNDQHLYQLFCLGLGEYDVQEVRIEDTSLWTSSGGYSDSFSDVQLQIIPPGSPVTLFPAAVITSVEVGGQDMTDANWLGPFIANPSDRNTDKLQIDLIYPRGLYYARDDGGLANNSITVYVEARTVDASGTPTGAWTRLETYTLSLATATPQRVTRSYDVTLGRYEVRVARSDVRNDNTRYADDIQWASMRAFISDDNVFSDVTLMAVKMRASNQLTSQSSRRFNVIMTAKLPVWDGTSWSQPQTTRSVAWAAADILRNSAYGAGKADSLIDLTALRALDLIGGQRGDTFDAIFDRSQALWTSLGQCLLAGRAQPLLIAGRVSFVRDQDTEITRGVFTPRNIVRDSFETTHVLYDEDSPDSVIVEFLDERTWQKNEVLCSLNGSTGNNPARVELFGIVNRTQAWREGMYQAAVNLYRRVFASLSTEMEGRILVRGDSVAVSHDMLKWGLSAEPLSWDRNSLLLQVNEPAPDDTAVLGMSDRCGRLWGPVAVSAVSEQGFALTLDAADLAVVEADQGEIPLHKDLDQEPTRLMFGSLQNYSKKFKVVGTRPDRSGSVQVTLTNDDPRVYGADSGLPPDETSYYGPGTVPDAPNLTGLVIAQDPQSPANPVLLNASWNAAPGATTYVLQTSSDGVTWQTAYEGSATTAQMSVEAGPVYIRVAAIGTFRGPWTTPDPTPISYGTALLVPSQPQNLETEADTSGGVVTASWSGAPRATSYRVELYTEDNGVYDQLKITKTTAGTSLLITSGEVSDANGPWESYRLSVTPVNDVGDGAAAVVTISDVVMDPPSSVILVTEYSGQSVDLQWTPVASATSYEVSIFQDGVQQGAAYNTVNSRLLITSAQLASAGGPWRLFEVKVKAVNGTLVSDGAALEVSDSAPSAPEGIVTASPSPGRVEVSWGAVTGEGVTEYVLHRSDAQGFTTLPETEVHRGTETSAVLTNLPPGTSFFRLVSEDSYAGEDGFNQSPEFNQGVT